MIPGPPPEPDPSIELTAVYHSGSPALIAVAKTILESAGIEYSVRGELVQDLFGWGRFPKKSNLVVGPIEIQVRANQADEALALLADVEPCELDAGELDESEPGEIEPALRADYRKR